MITGAVAVQVLTIAVLVTLNPGVMILALMIDVAAVMLILARGVNLVTQALTIDVEPVTIDMMIIAGFDGKHATTVVSICDANEPGRCRNFCKFNFFAIPRGRVSHSAHLCHCTGRFCRTQQQSLYLS